MPVAKSRLDEPIRHGTRRYAIYRDHFVTCDLVYEGNGRWHVEKMSSARERVRLTLREFETSETGKRLAGNLTAALAVAQEDL
jgi:hypothetical protein